MTRSEIIAEHLATLRASVAGGEEDHAHIAFKRVVYAALATPGCEAQGVRLVDLPHLAERVAEMADAHERVVGERDAARTLLNLVSEALSGGEAPVDRLPELVFAMGQRFAAAVDARDAARAERDELAATLTALRDRIAYLEAGMGALVRHNAGTGACLPDCITNTDDGEDCNCGYMAAEDPGGFAADLLSGAAEVISERGSR